MIGKLLLKNIKEEKELYIKISIVFFVGIIFSVMSVNQIGYFEKEGVAQYFSIFQEKVSTIDSNQFCTIFINSFFNKFKLIGIIMILAFLIIGSKFIYLVVLYKGFSFGYVSSSCLSLYGIKRGVLFFISVLGIQNIIFIPFFIFFAVYSIKFSEKIKNKSVDIKHEFLKYFIIIGILLIISMISSCSEVFISYKILKKIKVFY